MSTRDVVETYERLARQCRLYANLTERYGNVQQAEQLREDAALYDRTAAWVQQQNKLESAK